MDLASYDYLVSEMLKQGVKRPSQESNQINSFLRLTRKHRLSPTKQQLCLLVDKFCTQPQMEQMSLDQRFNILQLVATFESRVCRVTLQEPYFDELHDFYELEIDGFAGQNIDRIDHAVVLKSLTSALLRAKYRPADAPLFFSRLGERTLELLRPHR